MRLVQHIKTLSFLQQTLPVTIAALLVLSMLVLLAHPIESWRMPSSEISLNQQRALSHLKPVAQAHLFGRYLASLADLPPTQLPLSLEGTIINPQHGHDSIALIKSGNKTKLYYVGDSLPGDATIDHITRSQVVLKLHGQLQSLALPEPKLQTT